RFDYCGTGDSSGRSEDVESVDDWVEDITCAVREVRRLGATQVGLVGLRLGATLAALAAQRDGDIEALALWDPCSQGRGLLREQRALKLLSVGATKEDPAGSVELLSIVLSPSMGRELRALKLEPTEVRWARHLLLLERSDRARDEVLHGALQGQEFECRPADGQSEFVNVQPGDSVVPQATIDDLLSWLPRVLASGSHHVEAPRTGRPIDLAVDGGVVREQTVSLGGPGLFGIVAEPASGASGGPTILLLNVGLLRHVGPGRIWVEVARRLALLGMRSVRFDLRGIGDSPRGPGPSSTHPVEALDDIVQVMEAVSPSDPSNVVLVGICSGAYHAAEIGVVHAPKGVCLLNPVLFFDPAEVRAGLPLAAERQTVQPVHPMIRWLRRNPFALKIAHHPVVDKIRYGAPFERFLDSLGVLWWLLDVVGVHRSPAKVLQRLAKAQVDTLFVAGHREARPFRRCRWLTRPLVAAGLLRFETVEHVDHSLFTSAARQDVCELVESHLLVHFGPPRGVVGTDVPSFALTYSPRHEEPAVEIESPQPA
ncbi:MAG: exosortase system-associated hydrolase 2, partial [Acidimicrobiaceae bacterium]|nr:exosortase system-associated hydrolase 2 [Acidimicrobiaceae bacterium]